MCHLCVRISHCCSNEWCDMYLLTHACPQRPKFGYKVSVSIYTGVQQIIAADQLSPRSVYSVNLSSKFIFCSGGFRVEAARLSCNRKSRDLSFLRGPWTFYCKISGIRCSRSISSYGSKVKNIPKNTNTQSARIGLRMHHLHPFFTKKLAKIPPCKRVKNHLYYV